jgi:hypothetical protein
MTTVHAYRTVGRGCRAFHRGGCYGPHLPALVAFRAWSSVRSNRTIIIGAAVMETATATGA